MSDRQQYPRSEELWPEEGVIWIVDCDNHSIARIPVRFLIAAGEISWDFVIYCLTCCVDGAFSLRSVGSGALVVGIETPVTAGKYVCLSEADTNLPVRLAQGPESKRKGRPPNPSGSISTMSNSKRSGSNRQDSFREYLIARDMQCLLSDTLFPGCTASHIVPVSRPDLYQKLLDQEEPWLFHPWAGLLLEDKIHRAHDAGSLALYPKANGDIVVHIFYDRLGSLQQYHGKVLRPSRFRGPTSWLPDRRLLLFQHRNCVQMHFRGFAVAISATDVLRSQ